MIRAIIFDLDGTLVRTEHVMDTLGLGEASAGRMAEFGVAEPWQAFVQIRLAVYSAMTADQDLLRENRWLHNVALARGLGCRVGLATASSCKAAKRVHEAIELSDAFDFIATDDDVECGKPDPEISNAARRPSGGMIHERAAWHRNDPDRLWSHRGSDGAQDRAVDLPPLPARPASGPLRRGRLLSPCLD